MSINEDCGEMAMGFCCLRFSLAQADMREFLNAPNGSSKQSSPLSQKQDADPSQSPLGGRTERIVQLQDAQKAADVTLLKRQRESSSMKLN